jgi:hypothetical protein
MKLYENRYNKTYTDRNKQTKKQTNTYKLIRIKTK